jgi:Nucleotidyltransferase domain
MCADLNTIRAEIDGVLRPAGLTWVSLERSASQVVLFGSRAADVAEEESDWDLLIVGDGKPVHTKRIDLVWIPPGAIRSERWLGSELASHVAAYGRWLLGADDWSSEAHISCTAVERKRIGVEFQLRELNGIWSSLLPAARARHITRLRRDVQRLSLLRNGEAVPPRHHLDATWMRNRSPPENLAELLTMVQPRRH